MDDAELEEFRWSNISIVFQSAMNSLNPVMRIRDQLLDVMQHHGLPKEQANQRAVQLFDLVGIDPQRLDAYPHQLSGGMRQRAVIAIALAVNPDLIIMDEPTTALDVVVQKDILQQIARLREKLGFSILFITHDLSLLVEFSSRILIMYAGEIVEDAPARELFDNPLHPYTVGLMNSFPSISGEKRKLTGIPGSPPDLVAPPSGCRFHPRCPQGHGNLFADRPRHEDHLCRAFGRLPSLLREAMHSFDLETDPILEVRGLTKHFPVGSIFKTRYVHAVEDRLLFGEARPGGGAGGRIRQRQDHHHPHDRPPASRSPAVRYGSRPRTC